MFMKTQNLVLLVAAFGSFIPRSAIAQGSLAPPGPPGATMKTLDQIEPRTPISSLPFPITNSGSYYFTTNLILANSVTGISISADNVTLDLAGFALLSASTSTGSGINISSSKRNICIRNGTIRGWFNGIDASVGAYCRFEGLMVS